MMTTRIEKTHPVALSQPRDTVSNTVQPQTRALFPKCKCLSCCSSGMGTESWLPEDWKLPQQRASAQHCSSELFPGPSQASLTLPPWHSFPATFRFTQPVKEKHLQRLVHSHVAVNVVVMTIHSVWFTEQVVFTSVHKVKPPALILHKNKTMGQVHDSEGLVQIFAK